MANDASVTFSATVLPDEIARTIAGSITVDPSTVGKQNGILRRHKFKQRLLI